MIREKGLKVLFPERTYATFDHIVPTAGQTARPFADPLAEEMMQALEKNKAYIEDYRKRVTDALNAATDRAYRLADGRS